MSVKNKSKDRDAHGRINRKYTGHESTYWLAHTPRWWIKIYMVRPKRRLDKKLCQQIPKTEDYDSLVFPVGNRKPHVYYW
jgi:hypothetical protein